MNLLEKMNKHEIREFFSKGWMTHDAMWFYQCLQNLEPQKANEMNQAAVKAMSLIEIQRILKLMGRGKGPVKTFDELKDIIDTAFQLVKTDFMKFSYDYPEKNLCRGGYHECFAYEGLKKFGMIDSYQCGIFVRIFGWFEGLGVPCEVTPEIKGCLMHETGKCELFFRCHLD